MPSLPHNAPAGWLCELVRQHPAHLNWDISLRAAVCVGLPLSIGILAGDILAGLWISMGTLLLCSGESGTSTYRALIRQTLISAPIGAAGYLAGYLTLLPYPATLAAMTALSFAAAIMSSYGTVFSVGSMQAMLTACIAIGLPFIGNFWMPALLFLVGAAFYILLLGLEILMDRRRPQRIILATHIRALAAFANQKADDDEDSKKEGSSEQARRTVTDSFDPLYAALMAEGYRSNQGHSADLAQKAAVIKAADSIFSIMTAAPQTGSQGLRAAAAWLNALADALIHRRAPPPLSDALAAQSHLNHSLQQLEDAIWHKGGLPYVDTLHPNQDQDQASALSGHAADPGAHPTPKTKPLPVKDRTKLKRWLLRAKLTIGRDAIFSASVFALCMGVAFASKYVIDGSHWFWVPLTVALVMKPDFGSVFARAVLRTLGTAGGVVIAALMLNYVPKGQPLVFAIALLAGLLSWGKARSYAVQAVILAPLVLVLVDVIIPGTRTIDYALQRFQDTAVGGLIVIVFGYAFWPKVDAQQLGNSFIMALTDAANYLRAACAQDQGDARFHAAQRQHIFDARHLAYRDLSNIRSQLQKHMAEPPPAGIRAAAWLPIIAGAERLCDSITAYSSGRTLGDAMPDPAHVEALARRMEHLAHEAHAHDDRSACPYAHDTRNGSFLCDINSEIDYLAGLLEQAPGGSADSAARVLSKNTADAAISAAKHPASRGV